MVACAAYTYTYTYTYYKKHLRYDGLRVKDPFRALPRAAAVTFKPLSSSSVVFHGHLPLASWSQSFDAFYTVRQWSKVLRFRTSHRIRLGN